MSKNIDLSETQQYLEWLKVKLYLNTLAPNAAKRVIKRGEVYKCQLGYGIGSEENKERPCVILQGDSANSTSPNTIVAPITHTNSSLRVVVPLANKYDLDGNLILDGNALLGNIVCVNKARLGDYITTLDPTEMKSIDTAIAYSLNIKHYYDTLNNIYNDKLTYISILKNKITTVEKNLREKENEIKILNKIKEELGLEDLNELEKEIRKLIKNSRQKE